MSESTELVTAKVTPVQLAPFGVSVVSNFLPSVATVILPDGEHDGVVKEIVNEFDGKGPSADIYVQCNHVDDHSYLVAYDSSISLLWSADDGGWSVIS